MQETRLYRSQSDSVIAGVCGGLGNYLNIDPVVFRVLFVVAILVGGSGLLVYIILWIIIPQENVSFINSKTANNDIMTDETKTNETNTQFESDKKPPKNDGNLWGGLILISLGAIFLIDRFVPRIDFGDLWPLILIVIGIILITKSYQHTKK
ncbi:MAG: PspC domain-containing protein [Bacteroidales bacterium]